jgi:hypothetical protein
MDADWHEGQVDGNVVGVLDADRVAKSRESNDLTAPSWMCFGEGWRPGWLQGSGKRYRSHYTPDGSAEAVPAPNGARQFRIVARDRPHPRARRHGDDAELQGHLAPAAAAGTISKLSMSHRRPGSWFRRICAPLPTMPAAVFLAVITPLTMIEVPLGSNSNQSKAS